jgi:FKBP-type peptidyl-prolyl cis-trans isomerases 1
MADDDVKVRKERDPIMVVCFVVFLVASLSVIGASVYNNYIRADDTIAVNGDTVSVNYVGTYYDYFKDVNYVVFDTSNWSVTNNDNVPKSNDFVAKEKDQHSPLSFTVGGNQVLSMFGNSVIGHKVGDKIRVMIPAGEGYNSASTDSIISASANKTVPVSERISMSQFEHLYGYELRGTAEIEKSVYGWPASAAFNSSDNTVTMNYLPVASKTYVAVDSDFGKVSLAVISVGADITFRYVVTDYTVVGTEGTNKIIQMIMVDFGVNKFYISSVVDADNNGTADSFVTRTEAERYNQDLYFEIEIVSIN